MTTRHIHSSAASVSILARSRTSVTKVHTEVKPKSIHFSVQYFKKDVIPRRIHRFSVSRRCLFRWVNKNITSGKPVIRRKHLLKLFHRMKSYIKHVKGFRFYWIRTCSLSMSDAIIILRRICNQSAPLQVGTCFSRVLTSRPTSSSVYVTSHCNLNDLLLENRTAMTSRRRGSELLHVGMASSVNYRKMSSLTIR